MWDFVACLSLSFTSHLLNDICQKLLPGGADNAARDHTLRQTLVGNQVREVQQRVNKPRTHIFSFKASHTVILKCYVLVTGN